MYDLMDSQGAHLQPGGMALKAGAAAPAQAGMARQGNSGALGLRAMLRMLDVVDYGMLVVVDENYVIFANQGARAEMDEEHPLQLLGRDLRARCPRDVAALRQALSGAVHRGMQTMLSLGGDDAENISVAIMPLLEPGEAPAALVVLGKRAVCEDLSSDAFARLHALTLAETRVLKQLCAGVRPDDIAKGLGVKLTTVRTQIGSIRAKTGSHDIGALVHRVARLPPLPCVARRAV